jgi:DNA-directed RNA polymerase subunit F
MSLREARMDIQFEDRETLRLLKAFHGVKNAEVRRLIVEIVEAAARGDEIKVRKADLIKQ